MIVLNIGVFIVCILASLLVGFIIGLRRKK